MFERKEASERNEVFETKEVKYQEWKQEKRAVFSLVVMPMEVAEYFASLARCAKEPVLSA
jgi:hypothetical protein